MANEAGGVMAAIDPHTQERVYLSLKAEYRAGLLEPGRRLDLQEWADRHQASKTPLREAACRLLGERLFERHPDGGFMVPVHDAGKQAQLYAWNAQVLLGLIQLIPLNALIQVLGGLTVNAKPSGKLEVALLTGLLFERLASATGNDCAVDTIRSINEQLHYVRMSEPFSLVEATRELHGLTNCEVTDVHRTMRRRVSVYHDKRISICGAR